MAGTGFCQPALGGLNLLDHHTHNSVVLLVDGGAVESLSLTREDPAEEHDLDYVDKFNLLVHQVLDAGLESGHLFRITPRQALSFQEVSRVGMPDWNLGAAAHSGSRGSVM